MSLIIALNGTQNDINAVIIPAEHFADYSLAPIIPKKRLLHGVLLAAMQNSRKSINSSKKTWDSVIAWAQGARQELGEWLEEERVEHRAMMDLDYEEHRGGREGPIEPEALLQYETRCQNLFRILQNVFKREEGFEEGFPGPLVPEL